MYVDHQKNGPYSKYHTQEILLSCYTCLRCWYLQIHLWICINWPDDSWQ